MDIINNNVMQRVYYSFILSRDIALFKHNQTVFDNVYDSHPLYGSAIIFTMSLERLRFKSTGKEQSSSPQ